MKKKILLSIAGYDPSGGAGAMLDVRVFESLGFHGMAVLTSLTVQNTVRVTRVRNLPASFLLEQFKTLAEDVSFEGIKVGMLGTERNISPLADILDANRKIPVVVDPVFRSTSGAWLLEKKAIPRFFREIAGRASIITPNLVEAELICGIKPKSVEEMTEAAKRIFGLSGTPCLIKGQNLIKEVADLLYDGEGFFLFKNPKLRKMVHGSGCFLSSAILGFLAQGHSLRKACRLAVRLAHKAIAGAETIGRGQKVIIFPRAAEPHSPSPKIADRTLKC